MLASIFRSFWGAWRTIAGYEAIHMIRKGQAWNGTIQLAKRMARGFKSFVYFQNRRLPPGWQTHLSCPNYRLT